jgi:carnitine O-acetyltransferase
MRRGQFYWFDVRRYAWRAYSCRGSGQVIDSHNRPCLTERELLNNLKAIIDDADKTPPNQVAQSAIGVLSTEHRRVWAEMRRALSDQENNRSCLDIIDSALFIVCLDDTTPESASEMSTHMLCGSYKLDKGVQIGTCTNRYYDKVHIATPPVGPLLTCFRAASDHRCRQWRGWHQF